MNWTNETHHEACHPSYHDKCGGFKWSGRLESQYKLLNEAGKLAESTFEPPLSLYIQTIFFERLLQVLIKHSSLRYIRAVTVRAFHYW